MISHGLTRALVGTSALALVAGALVLAPAATATPAFHAQGRVVVGDLTADGVADRLTLGSVPRGNGSVCAFQLQAGLGHGAFGAPWTGVLPIASTDPAGPDHCPDAGVVVKAPDRSRNQLAVTSTTGAMADPSVQLFRGFAGHAVRYAGGFTGQYQPSTISSTDLDGDGWGDVWETTDQGDGFTAWLGRPTTGWHQLYATPPTSGASPQFFDLNHAGGTDVLVTWTDLGALGAGAAVVDGRTGAVQTLGGPSDDPDVYSSTFELAVVDLNHDGYPDLRLTRTDDRSDGSQQIVTTTFLNRSQGGRWYFQALPQPGA